MLKKTKPFFQKEKQMRLDQQDLSKRYTKRKSNDGQVDKNGARSTAFSRFDRHSRSQNYGDAAKPHLVDRFDKQGGVQNYGDGAKPHLVHRLDKHATGIMVVATNSYAARELSESLRNLGWHKTYITEVEGIVLQKSGRIDDPIIEKSRDYVKLKSGEVIVEENFKEKSAITEYQVLAYRNGRTIVELRPVTGRMHQLRQHCAKHLYPIVGDEKYWQRRDEASLELDKINIEQEELRDKLEEEKNKNGKQEAKQEIIKNQIVNELQLVDDKITDEKQKLLESTLAHSSFNRPGLRLRCVELSFEFKGKRYSYK